MQSTTFHGRLTSSRPAFVSAALATVMAVVVAVAPASASSAAVDGASSMPAPEAFARPAQDSATSQTNDSYTLTVTSVRLKGTRTVFRIDTTSGKVLRQRKVDFGLSTTYRSNNRLASFGGKKYAKLTSGTYSGWFVAANAMSLSSTDLGSSQRLRLSQGKYPALRFYSNNNVKTIRWLSLTAAETYGISKRATVGSRTFYLVSDGPLANRWVAKGTGVSLVSVTNSTVSSTGATPPPEPTPTPSPTPSVQTTTWKTLALVYRETDVTFPRNGSSYRLRARMSDSTFDTIHQLIGQTKRTVNDWSGGLAAWNLTMIDVPHPVTNVVPLGSGYWVNPDVVKSDLDKYAPTGTYDSVILVWEPRDSSGVEIPVPAWGLTMVGGWWSNGAGFSSVITLKSMSTWTGQTYPEEVFVHEWMHQVIYFHEQAGRMKLDLHAGSQYGYSASNGSWKKWTSDVMRGLVWDAANNKYIGVKPAIWQAATPTRP
jgi:hypothetical protein